MKTTSLMAGASRFAHFAGLTRSSRRAAEDDDSDKQARRADEDEDDKSASDQDDGEPAKGKRGKARGADDDDGKDASDEDDGKDASEEDDDDDDKPAGKRARASEDDDDDKDADDDEDEMKGKGASATARRREQARIAHILGHKAAAANPVLAVSLACDTRMTRREAVAVLRSQPAGASGASDNRHARRDRQDRNVVLGSDAGQPTGKQAVKASWDAAFKKAGVTTR